MLEIKDIRKSYQMGSTPMEVLKGISLKIEAGDFVAIMGPSGSGKSTLMHILGLLDVPTTGSYRLNGLEVAKLSEDELAVIRRKEVGFIFQQFNLLPRIEAWKNVSLPLTYTGDGFDFEKGSELLKQVGLEDRLDHKSNELSGGQQQRVAIARSLVNKPQIIFADEPTGNLDSQSEKEVLAILRKLNEEGITIIIVTHEEEIGQQAKRLIRLRDGVLQSDERLSPLQAVKVRAAPDSNPKSSGLLNEFYGHLVQGFQTLWANKVRTALSMLGIMIGVAAVVGTLAVGSGAQRSIESQMSSLGSNILVLRAGTLRVGGVAQESGSRLRINIEDIASLEANVAGISRVSGSSQGRGQATYLNKNMNTSINAVAPVYEKMRNLTPTYGRFFTDEENQRRSLVALVGATVVKELFGGKYPIGEAIKINRVNFRVIGVLPEKGSSGPMSMDDRILIPLNTGMYRLFGKNYVDSVDVEVVSAAMIPTVKEELKSAMSKRYKVPLASQDEAFTVFDITEIKDVISGTSKTMAILLASIAAISLVVGGVGIMNIMLVSVTERTKEIGLRKAIGARRQDILLQFLAESIVVSLSGGILGIILGVSFSVGISMLIGWPVYISPSSIIVSFVFSVMIGIVFGSYPAAKASRLHPIQALRFE